MKRTLRQVALAVTVCTLSAAHAAVVEKTSTLADQQSVAVTPAVLQQRVRNFKDLTHFEIAEVIA